MDDGSVFIPSSTNAVYGLIIKHMGYIPDVVA